MLALALVLTSGVALAQATTVREIRVSPVEVTLSDFCGGEPVIFNGEEVLRIRETTDANGGWHVLNDPTVHNFGVGAESGNKYIFVAHHQNIANYSRFPDFEPGEPFTGTLVDTAEGSGLLISQGSGDNFVSHYAFHLTINNNGEVVAEVGQFSADECKGVSSPN